jgi:hypothetical protein
VPITADSTHEPDETFSVYLNSVNGGASISDSYGIGTILNDDATITPIVSVQVDQSSISESNESAGATFTVNRTTSDGDLTVYYQLAGDASVGIDYTAPSQSFIVIPSGEYSASFTVYPIDDSEDDDGESITFDLAGGSYSASASAAFASVIVEDNDISVPTVSINDVSVVEGTGSATNSAVFTISLDSIHTQEVVVVFETLDETAESSLDYSVTAGSVTISAGQSAASVAVPIVADDEYEPNEMFWVRLNSASGGVEIDDHYGIAHVIDDDTPSFIPSASVSGPASVSEGSVASFLVSLNSATDMNVTVGYRVIDGTAEVDSDYSAGPGYVVIPANETSGTIEVVTIDDNVFELGEDFVVVLEDTIWASVTGGYVETEILENDLEYAPQISVNDVSVVEGTGSAGTSAVFQVSLQPAGEYEVVVHYSAIGGTAHSGQDYTLLSGSLTFSAGESIATIAVPIASDSIFEADETFSISLSNATNATIADPIGVATIENDDQQPFIPQVSINSDVSVSEGSTANLVVSLDSASGQDVTVFYYLLDGTATLTDDYAYVSQSTVIPAGQLSATIAVETKSDSNYAEGNESFSVVLMPAIGASASGTGVATIIDAELEELPELAVTNSSVVEGDSTGTSMVFSVSLTSAASTDVVFYYHTFDGSALSGSDYTSVTGSMTISAGHSVASVAVPVSADTDYEEDESFFLRLSEATGATIGENGVAVATIQNDDSAPTLPIVSIDYNPDFVSESNPTLGKDFVIRRDTSAGDLTVAFHLAGEATPALDYNLSVSTGYIVIPDGSLSVALTIYPVDDSDEEGWEDVELWLDTGDDYALLETSQYAELFIEDEDVSAGSLVAVSSNLSEISEENVEESAILSFFRTDTSTSATVQYSISGSAINGAEYEDADTSAALSGFVSFSIGQSVATIEVSAIDDEDEDEFEDDSLEISIPGNSLSFVSIGIRNRRNACYWYPLQGTVPPACQPVELNPQGNTSSSLGSIGEVNEWEFFTKTLRSPEEVPDYYSYEISWGDGAHNTYFPGDVVSHRYADDAPLGTPQDDYPVTIKARQWNGFTHTYSGTITVKNVQPVANDDFASTDQDTEIYVDVFANDTDAAPTLFYDPLTIVSVNGASSNRGQLTLVDGGLFRYDPRGEFDDLPQGQTHTDVFNYYFHDGDELENPSFGVLEVTVTGKKEFYYVDWEVTPAKEEGQEAGVIQVTIDPPAKAGGFRIQWSLDEYSVLAADATDFEGPTSGILEIEEGESVGYITLTPVDDAKPEIDETARVLISIPSEDSDSFATANDIGWVSFEVWDNEWRWVEPSRYLVMEPIVDHEVNDLPDPTSDLWSAQISLNALKLEQDIQVSISASSNYLSRSPGKEFPRSSTLNVFKELHLDPVTGQISISQADKTWIKSQPAIVDGSITTAIDTTSREVSILITALVGYEIEHSFTGNVGADLSGPNVDLPLIGLEVTNTKPWGTEVGRETKWTFTARKGNRDT